MFWMLSAANFNVLANPLLSFGSTKLPASVTLLKELL